MIHMKKIAKIFSLLIAPIMLVCAFIAGCARKVDIENTGIMQDIDVAPEQTPAYEQYSRQAYEDYKEVANRHSDSDGTVDFENEEVIKAANTAAAKLFAYACYNERTLDKYVYFSHQEGYTDLGKDGSAKATRQEYYLRVNETEKTCGYRYHYTIKKVEESSGVIGTFKSLFESARIRFTDRTDLLYRFEGDNIRTGSEHEKLRENLLECDWKTGADWGKPDVVMKKSDFIAPEDIENDIVQNAGEDNITIRANINILAENIIKNTIIFEDEEGCISCFIFIDTDVANKDEASLKMLRKANSSGDCKWEKGVDESGEVDDDDTGFMMVCRFWPNGLFRSYSVTERWNGHIAAGPLTYAGTVESNTQYYYSYSDKDCDMTKNLEMLEDAKVKKG